MVSLEELATLLAELAAVGGAHGESAGARQAYEERPVAARWHAEELLIPHDQR